MPAKEGRLQLHMFNVVSAMAALESSLQLQIIHSWSYYMTAMERRLQLQMIHSCS